MDDLKAIKETVLAIYQTFEDTDENAFRALVHPDMRTVSIGNNGEVNVFPLNLIVEYTIKGLKNAKESISGFFSRREDVEFLEITIEGPVAMASVRYKMIMPEHKGHHTSGIHLVKEDGKWRAIQIIDRGIEQTI